MIVAVQMVTSQPYSGNVRPLRMCACGHRLRGTVWVVMVLPPSCKKLSERFLQLWALSSGSRGGLSYGGPSPMQGMWVFSCTCYCG